MLRILATLAFAVSFDLLFFDGKYTDAAKQLARKPPVRTAV